LLIIPIVFTIIFNYMPMFGIIIAFKDYNIVDGIFGSKWVGFKHFIKFVHSYEFSRIIKNTLDLSIYSLIAGAPIPIILALSLNIVKNKYFKGFIQTITYAPHFISVVVFIGIIYQILDPRIGIINNIISSLGGERINFMAKKDWFDDIYVWSGVWQGMGFSAIIYLAVLSNIDVAMYEAATIDGANLFQKIKYIDIPSIMPTFVILFILSLGGILSVGFEKVLLLQNNINLSVSEVISTHVYRKGLKSAIPQFSYAAAIGLFQSVIGLMLLLITNKLSKKLGQKALW